MADGIISPDDEGRLKEFNNQVAPIAVPKIQAPNTDHTSPGEGSLLAQAENSIDSNITYQNL